MKKRIKVSFVSLLILVPVICSAQNKQLQRPTSTYEHDVAVLSAGIAMNAVTRCVQPQGDEKKTCYTIAIDSFSRMASKMTELLPAGISRDDYANALKARAEKALADMR